VILVVAAKDLKVGMECVGPVLFGDYGVVTAISEENGNYFIDLDDAPPIGRPPHYEFEVLVT